MTSRLTSAVWMAALSIASLTVTPAHAALLHLVSTGAEGVANWTTGRIDVSAGAFAGFSPFPPTDGERVEASLTTTFRYVGASVTLPAGAFRFDVDAGLGAGFRGFGSSGSTYSAELWLQHGAAEASGTAMLTATGVNEDMGSRLLARSLTGELARTLYCPPGYLPTCTGRLGSEPIPLTDGDLVTVVATLVASAGASNDSLDAYAFAGGEGRLRAVLPDGIELDPLASEAEWIAVVPLPGALLLFATAVAGLAGLHSARARE